MAQQHKQSAFTIVELLIVIVVIAILAALTVVAYNGIQSRSYDSAIQNDLNKLSKSIMLAAADTGEYPAGGAVRTGGSSTGNSRNFPNFTFKPSKDVYYMADGSNLFYCTGQQSLSGEDMYRLLARSKSGNLFQYESDGSLTNLGSIAAGSTLACQDMDDPQTWSYGWCTTCSGGTWWDWTNG